MTERCLRCDALESQVHGILKTLVDLTTAQREAFAKRDNAAFVRLDKELELTVGEKERSIGALKEHTKEHRFQSLAAGKS